MKAIFPVVVHVPDKKDPGLHKGYPGMRIYCVPIYAERCTAAPQEFILATEKFAIENKRKICSNSRGASIF